ncbi:NAD-dependent epimerase/dehydratase family protein [Magnetospirillum sp. UT-4]|uniref:NAD-dependent epimerase/dehydratase family protein n=1 Tax=Magnetospirillum sp. UT-4 TaxID=2681467 RepID=UPI001571BD8B|nr:NAD-dependent epimerase/dehydratase family protein [Magnetospirillum sp. UT-4]
MRILCLGGDGFCGWPISLHLSRAGHQIGIVDNLARRKIDLELETESLTPIRPIRERIDAWRDTTGQSIDYFDIDVAEQYDRLLAVVTAFQPDAIVHLAEQRAAPYSMKSSWHKRYTVSNNLNATNNVLAAVAESGRDIHIVHIGTMGVYGYATAGMTIPEGYLKVKVTVDSGEEIMHEILYPTSPGSIYHMTKSQDQLLFSFYNRNDGIRVTDLHQGIVWGTQTAETKLDSRLINRFDYDGDFGTVLNRFLVQAAAGHPLTVYGNGGQTRAFINIEDTVRCVRLAIESAPRPGERVRIFNQMTETFRVRELAELVASMTGARIAELPNPRVEAAENELKVDNSSFLGLGLDPIRLEVGLLEEIRDIARTYVNRCHEGKIACSSFWTEERRRQSQAAGAGA